MCYYTWIPYMTNQLIDQQQDMLLDMNTQVGLKELTKKWSSFLYISQKKQK